MGSCVKVNKALQGQEGSAHYTALTENPDEMSLKPWNPANQLRDAIETIQHVIAETLQDQHPS